jgi:iron complex outermembrane receptor protein
VRLVEPAAIVTILCLAAAPAAAQQQTVSFDIPAGRLSDALIVLGQQGGVTVGASDPALATIRSRPVRGRMSVRSALRRLLADSGYDFVFVNPRTVRIDRSAPPRRAASDRPRPPRPPAPVAGPEALEAEIIVTASKQGVALDRFGGAVHVVELVDEQAGRFGARGTDAVLSRLPVLTSTSLGPGRNKLFIRGVADSSFNGPSQASVGQTLGDVRLTFNAPDPSLHLYDMERVELLEGPQGTLYGTGALGGMLRLVPTPPQLGSTGASLATGLLSTRHGSAGADLSAMVNLPILSGRLAVRAVGYGSIDGGYIDDAGRGLTDVNRTSTYGGRVSILLDAGDGWNAELGGVAQYITARDGQYAIRGLPRLTRATALAQPFENDYLLGQLTVRKRWSGLELVSATGIVRHALETRFDATGFPGTSGPQLYAEDVDITLISNETRLSHPDARGEGWVIGVNALHNIGEIRRRLGPPHTTVPIAGIRNDVTEAALFGQYSIALTDRFAVTVGGRLTYSRTVGLPLDAEGEDGEPNRSDVRFSPTAAITWRLGRDVLLYGRFQQGFRAGGYAVAYSVSPGAVERFESDRLTSHEVGLRVGQRGRDRFSMNASLSYARWSDIQADLIDPRGLPFTTNIGDGRIFGFGIEAWWRAAPALTFSFSAFLNDGALFSSDPPFAAADERDLPSIADAGGRWAIHYRTSLSPGLAVELDGAMRYVGRSQLGIGLPLDIGQGGYLEARAGARFDFGRFGLSLDIDNLTDTTGNRFSFGNPFTVADRLQTTPLRPRTIRIGFDASF